MIPNIVGLTYSGVRMALEVDGMFEAPSFIRTGLGDIAKIVGRHRFADAKHQLAIEQFLPIPQLV